MHALVWGLVLLLAGRAEAAILINEVLADPPPLIGDADGNGVVSSLQDEFIELVNSGGEAVSLADWRLSDAGSVRHIFAADATIPAYGFLVVYGSTASSGGLSLNNAGDTVSLYDATLALIDQMLYGAEGGQDTSLTRSPDGAGPFLQHTTLTGTPFSPGLTLDGLALLPHDEPVPPPDETVPPPAGSSVPEPSAWGLMMMGLTGFQLTRRRRIMHRCDEETPADSRRAGTAGRCGDRGVHCHV